MAHSYAQLSLDEGTQPSAAQRRPARRRWLIGLAVVSIGFGLAVLLVHALAPRSPALSCVELSAPSGKASSARESSWNGLAFRLDPSCATSVPPAPPQMPRCSIDIDRAARYESLRGVAARRPILIAALLYNSEAIVNVWLRELPALIAFLGPQDVHGACWAEPSCSTASMRRLLTRCQSRSTRASRTTAQSS